MDLTLVIAPPATSSPSTPRAAPRVANDGSRPAVDLRLTKRCAGKRALRRNQAISVRATCSRPWMDCASAGTLPPPSPVSATSCAACLEPGEVALLAAAKNCRAASHVAHASPGTAAGAARRDVSHGPRAGARCPRSCPRSPRPPDTRSRRRHAGGAPLAVPARDSSSTSIASEAVGHLCVLRGIVAAVGDDRFRQPLAEVALATHACGAQLVDRQPCCHRRNERARRRYPLAGIERLMHTKQRFLHHVLGLGHAAEHPVGDRERDRPQLVEQALAIGHAAANPCRQLGCAGVHASSRLAFAFEAPRTSVIIRAPASPAKMRPTKRGTCIGRLAPRS